MSTEFYDYFGDPNAPKDIARSDSIVDDLFIETAAIAWFLRRDPEFHIIVGSKGTGKSLLLFKKAVLATKKSGIVIAPTPPQKAYAPGLAFADSERWVPYWPLQDQQGQPLLPQWASLWEWALLVTICHAWRRHAQRLDDRRLLRELDELLHGFDQDNPFALVAEALQSMATESGHVKGQALLPDSRPFRSFMLENVGHLPPPYVFLDNQDDLFFDYPEFWRASGQGCFMAIQQLHENSNHRIHIFITLRPEIIWELSQMQHYPQWTADVFHLQWRDHELIDVLRSRARYLKPDLLASPELLNEDPFSAFVGQRFRDETTGDFVIRVPLAEKGQDRITIPVRDHLLRHSLRRPREMIILGNAILDARRSKAGTDADAEATLRDAVDAKASNDIAKPYIAEVKHRWPWGTHPDQSLRRFIAKRINKNVLTPTEVRRIERAFAKEDQLSLEDARPFTRLASLGLIGWPIEDPGTRKLTQNFVLPGEQDVETLPLEIRWFLVHPVLYGAPFHVRVVPGNVIGPGLPFDESKQLKPPKYSAARLCCGPSDERFARRLCRDLRARGVTCCLSARRMAAVDRTEFGQTGQLLVVCSIDGLESRAVLDDVDEQVRRDPDRILSVSRDSKWRSDDFEILLGGRDLKRYLVQQKPIRFERGIKYSAALDQLLSALESRPKPLRARPT